MRDHIADGPGTKKGTGPKKLIFDFSKGILHRAINLRPIRFLDTSKRVMGKRGKGHLINNEVAPRSPQ